MAFILKTTSKTFYYFVSLIYHLFIKHVDILSDGTCLYILVILLGLVSLFNDISTFVACLIPNRSLYMVGQ